MVTPGPPAATPAATAPTSSASRPAATAALRRTVIAFAVGLLAGALFWLLRTPSPAPPWPALTGLLGMVLGERAVPLVRRDRPRPDRATPCPPSAST
jgi:XapX domain-containing protein